MAMEIKMMEPPEKSTDSQTTERKMSDVDVGVESIDVVELLRKQLSVPQDILKKRLKSLTGKEHQTVKAFIKYGSWHRSVMYITTTDDVYAMGRNGADINILGVTGEHFRADKVDRPVKVDRLSGKNIEFIALGENFGAALDKYGGLYCWGQKLDGTKDVLVPGLLTDKAKFKSVSCGRYMMAAIDEIGRVYVWGKVYVHKVQPKSHCMLHIELDRPVVQLSCGLDHLVMLTDDGQVYTWGSSYDGQRGYSEDEQLIYSEKDIHDVKKMELPEPCASVTCGTHGTWCLLHSGELWACGGNHNGTGGLGVANTRLHVFLPEKVLMPGKTLIMVSSWHTVGQAISVAVSSEREVYWWCESQFTARPRKCDENTIALLLNVFNTPHDHMMFVDRTDLRREEPRSVYVDVTGNLKDKIHRNLQRINEVVGV